MHWYVEVLKKYIEFSGRASRQEYWYFFLVHFIVLVALYVLGELVGPLIIFYAYLAATALPSVGAAVRRLHDTEKTGWWVLASIIPLVGPILLIILLALPGDQYENRYGYPPMR